MAPTHLIPDASLEALFAALVRAGHRILAPVDRDARTEFQEVASPAEVSTGHVQTVMSAKEAVFPKVERLLSYTHGGGGVTLEDARPNARPTVLWGLRPCEAAAFPALDAVFNWDSRDAFFNARMAAVTVVAMACTQADDACFCTSVGGAPDATKGADLLLARTEGGWLVEVLTDRGRALVAHAPEAFREAGDARPLPLAQVPAAFDAPALTAKLPGLFEDPLWRDQSLRCVGCGACAFVCPTCACFDLQEEADAREGRRLRCWDTCGTRLFTQHASGHNPREHQSQRWRQRIYHKFSYYPARMGMLGCVGCGKCSRACPADMDLREHLQQAAEVIR